MLILTPFFDQTKHTADEIKEAISGVDIAQVDEMFTMIYEKANSSDFNGTMEAASAHGSDGNLYEDVKLKVVGSAKINGARHMLCAGGIALNMDVTIALFAEMKATAEAI